MRNREYLMGMCLYDLLCKMNESVYNHHMCIMNVLYFDEVNSNKCGSHYTVDEKFEEHYDCKGCIAEWLNSPCNLRW